MTGLETNSHLARKLWLVSRIQGHKNPFGKPLSDYNVAELDFVLEMEALDDPKRFTFTRGGVSAGGTVPSERMAAWADVLTGPALADFMRGKFAPVVAAKQEARLRERQAILQQGLKPGVTRGGKAVATDA